MADGWCDLLHPALGRFARHSVLEPGPIHLRYVIEFLGDQPTGDRVMARDYVKHWEWKTNEQLSQVEQLHGCLAHLGVVRRSVKTDGSFSWESWITKEAPVVLRGFRDFLIQLRTTSPQRYQRLIHPRDVLPVIDLLALLDGLLADVPH